MDLDNYKVDCAHFYLRKTKRSEELNLIGKQPDEVVDLPFCEKDALRNNGCISDCPFYEKRGD